VRRPTDARAFLTARLVDLLIGEWDATQTSGAGRVFLARTDGSPFLKTATRPLSVRGMIHTLGRERLPQFVNFTEKYPDIDGLTWNGRDGDRPSWSAREVGVGEVATSLQSRINDAVIADAIARMRPNTVSWKAPDREGAAPASRRFEGGIRSLLPFPAKASDFAPAREGELAVVTHAENGDVAMPSRRTRTGRL
jgi:hypothetical protein